MENTPDTEDQGTAKWKSAAVTKTLSQRGEHQRTIWTGQHPSLFLVGTRTIITTEPVDRANPDLNRDGATTDRTNREVTNKPVITASNQGSTGYHVTEHLKSLQSEINTTSDLIRKILPEENF